MGKIITPAYRIEYRSNHLAMKKIHADMIGVDGLACNTMIWDTKYYGKPTVENLDKWRKTTNASYLPGGVNEHLSKSFGIDHIFIAHIVHQKTGNVVASVKAPPFEVI